MISQCLNAEPVLPTSRLCEVMEVSRSWYYERPSAQAPTEEDIRLRDAIERIILEQPGYGYRRVTHQLDRDGWTINHKRVLRIMRKESLLCRLKKRFVATTDSDHGHRVYPNLMKTFVPVACNQAWVADISYIRLPGGFCFLAAILDAFSRLCVGWHLSEEINTELTLAALEKAIALRNPPAGLIHHSDRGVQYACGDYTDRLDEIGALPSMSRVGNPYDNAKAESFFKTLKREEVYLNDYRTMAEALANLARFIEEVYNQKRLHSSLGYLPPVEFEAMQNTNTAMLPIRIYV
jgi:putative transposase